MPKHTDDIKVRVDRPSKLALETLAVNEQLALSDIVRRAERLSMAKDKDIKVRVPKTVKTAIKRLAKSRMTTESEIAREAMYEYLRKHSFSNSGSKLMMFFMGGS